MMRKMVVISFALILSFVFCSVSEAVNFKKAIIGKWVEVKKDGSYSAQIEFLKDGTVIIGSTVGDYKFIDDNRIRLNVQGMFGSGAMVLEVSIDKEGHLILTDPAGSISKHITKAEMEKRVAALEEKKRKAIEELKMPLEKRMVLVKGGCFQMGDTFGDGDEDAKPVHEVCVDDLYMGKYEVTQIQWEAVMGSNPSHFKGCDTCPVENVSWNDIQEYINKLNSKTGKKYRLPTEAEWEYAARSGGKNEKYAGGDDLDSVAWYDSNSGSKTHAVGQKKPNGLGLYDMSGNVWEWVQDWYDDVYYKNSPKNNPKGPDSGQNRVLRGGSWGNNARNSRTAYRNWNNPDFRSIILGFRVARTN